MGFGIWLVLLFRAVYYLRNRINGHCIWTMTIRPYVTFTHNFSHTCNRSPNSNDKTWINKSIERSRYICMLFSYSLGAEMHTHTHTRHKHITHFLWLWHKLYDKTYKWPHKSHICCFFLLLFCFFQQIFIRNIPYMRCIHAQFPPSVTFFFLNAYNICW